MSMTWYDLNLNIISMSTADLINQLTHQEKADILKSHPDKRTNELFVEM